MPYKNPEAARLAGRERQKKHRAKRRRERWVLPERTLGTMADFYEWCERVLRVPTGPLRGQPFVIPEWQRFFIDGAMQDGIREAALSCARKNGKSGIIAALLLGYLAGPLHWPQFRAVAVSLTGNLAKELRDAIELTAAASDLSNAITVYKSPAPGYIMGIAGARVDFLASDKATGHAVGADLALIDEAGLMEENQRDLWNSVFSSVSGRDGRLLCISVQGDGPMFAELRNRADERTVYWQEHVAVADAQLDDEDAWRAANPGLGSIKSLAYMRDAAARALGTPADAASFRRLDLNQQVSPNSDPIVDPAHWRACETDTLPPRDGPCVVGLDLGASRSMTAYAAFWPHTGRFEVKAAVGDEPELLTRSRNDGVGDMYVQMEKRGELVVYGGHTTPVRAFLGDMVDALSDSYVIAVGSDRFRKAELQQACREAGIALPLVWRGTGASSTADGSYDVREFQRAVYEERFQTTPSLLLRAAIAESSLRWDGAGNPALDKRRQNARIDALQAAVIAVGLGAKYRPSEESEEEISPSYFFG